MSEVLIKPYELSIWDNELTNAEQKIAVIGTHLLKTPNMAYNIVFKKDKNGEKTLSFDIKHKYYDLEIGQMVENPFVPYLINERKVKLFYNDEWYDFIIKEVEESSEEYTWSYVAYDAFILELSKNGYDVEFSNELNNNLGTAEELASRTLENTDWIAIDVDVPAPRVSEPVFEGKTECDVVVKNMDTNEDETITADTNVLIFYSYITNQNGKYLQFIKKEENENDYELDESTNTIIATNYRFDKDLTFEVHEEGGHSIYYIMDGDTPVLSYGYVYQKFDAYRMIYQQVSSYDAVMDRVVDQFTDGTTRINHYSDYIYTTSNVITSFVANGDNFSTYEDGSLYGWDKYGGTNTNWPDIKLTTYPEISAENPVLDINNINQIEGYLQVKFNATNNSYLYNDGIQSNQSFIGSISKGDKFVFRWRGGKAATDHGTLTKMSGDDLRAKVCFYKEITVNDNGTTRYAKSPISDIISFEELGGILNNIISGGTLQNNDTQYVLDGVVQVPSSKYLYATDLNKYYWDSNLSKYIVYNEETNQEFLDYYYLIGSALTAVTQEQLQDSTVKLGIFIYCNSEVNNYYYLQDIQLTRFYKDEADNVLTIGNIPKATAQSTDYYYLTPKEGDVKNKIPLFLSLEDLANEYGLVYENIKPIFNQGEVIFIDANTKVFWVKKERARQLYERFQVKGYALTKVASIEASHSNCFDILQTIAETFECWIDIYVEHNEDGSLFYDDDGLPLKTVLLREFSGNDNFAGFKYGINIDQIVRTIDSNEIVTKLIVDDSNSDLVEDGVVSIAQADSNPSKESYIYRFDYFLNQGLLPREEFTQELNDYNFTLKQLNTALYDLQAESIQLSGSLVQISSNRNVYSSLLTNAHEKMNEALDEFEDLTGYTYEEYQQLPSEDRDITEEVDKVLETIGTIYNCAAIENSYRGLYTNIESEYTDLHQKLNGIKEHAITVSCVQGEISRYLRVKVDDYIVPFKFTVEGIDYETSLSNKEFEIEVGDGNITISDIVYSTNSETGYQLLDSDDQPVTEIIVNSQIVQTYRLVPNSPTDGINSQINELIKQKKELIKQFNIKYGRFILEGNWSSQDYLSDELYYLDATIAGRVSAFPKVTYNINVVDISGLNDYQSYNFDAGEKTYIEDTEFFGWTEIDGVKTPVQEEVIISDIEWHLDDPSQNTITVQNYKTHFEDLFQRIQATVQTVQYNEVTYPNTRSIIDEEKRINQALLVASLSRVAGVQRPLTTDGSIAIDGDSIDILNLTNRLNRVRLSSEGITISSDGGVTWSAAITGEGINIGNVISDFINTKEIWIGSKDSPSFRWDKNGISAFMLGNESQGEPKYNFKQFVRFDRFGLYGIDLTGNSISEYIVNNIEDIKNTASFAVTWDGFFIKNKYAGGGQVEITSMNDFRVLTDPACQGNLQEKIKIGALEWGRDTQGNPITDPTEEIRRNTQPTKYGIRIRNNQGDDVFTTDDYGNLVIANTVSVGDNTNGIIIDGANGYIKTANYQDGAGLGWKINKDGDATFNNITARGAIKTAVFEYAEIQAVGGIFIFRPSSTIRSARLGDTERGESSSDLILTVEKPIIFKEHSWCKISNYTETGEANDPDVDISDVEHEHSTAQEIANNNGLLHIYEISDITTIDDITYITLNGAAAMIGPIVQGYAVDNVNKLVGGALVDMGNSDSNYGIGINSSDNTVNLPAKAISLFETVVNNNPNANPKVTYNYTAILGTLPTLPEEQVNSIYNNQMIDTQGIYTNNMYIGDANQYIAFYTGNESPAPEKHFIIRVKEFELEANSLNQGSPTTGYVYLSNTNKYLSGDGTGWRLLLGSNFRVSEAGNLYASNATISGDITASSGHIANWIIETKNTNTNLYPYGGAIYTEASNSSFGDTGNVYITPGYLPATAIDIGGSKTNNETWAIVAGNGFGVTTDGKLYANNAHISGAITATSLDLTGASITGLDLSLYVAKDGTIGNTPSDGATGFVVSSEGLLKASNAVIFGELYASKGYIGGWQIGTDDNKSLHNGSANVSPTPASGTVILSKGIAINAVGNLPAATYAITAGTDFGVTTAGAMYAKSGNVAGWTINAGSLSWGTIDNNSTSKLYLGSVDTTNNITIGNSGGRKDWRLLVGNKFGVDDEGNLYANGGNIGGCTFESGLLKVPATQVTGNITVTTDKISYASNYYAQISGQGLKVYSGSTIPIAQFGSDVILGLQSQQYIKLTSTNLQFGKNYTVFGSITPFNTSQNLGLAIYTEQNGNNYVSLPLNPISGSAGINIRSGSSSSTYEDGDLTITKSYCTFGNSKVEYGSTTKHDYIMLSSDYFSIYHGTGSYSNSVFDVKFSTGVTTITSSGTYSLNCNSRVRANYTNSNSDYDVWIGRGYSNNSWTNNRGLYDGSVGEWIVKIASGATASSKVTTGFAGFDTGSDKKRKDIIGSINYAKDFILGLNPVQFYWKAGDHKKISLGFIAQEVYNLSQTLNINLDLVTAHYKEDDRGYYKGGSINDKELDWFLSYDEIIAPLVKVVQDQQKEINELKTRIQVLEGK